ncbi:MAG: STAS domain-containing protein [Fibrobacterota bacterium]
MGPSLKTINDCFVYAPECSQLKGDSVKEFSDFIKANPPSEGYRKVIINLQQVVFIDSNGMNLLIRRKGEIESNGLLFYLYGIKEEVMDLFSLCNLTNVFKIIANKNDYETVTGAEALEGKK